VTGRAFKGRRRPKALDGGPIGSCPRDQIRIDVTTKSINLLVSEKNSHASGAPHGLYPRYTNGVLEKFARLVQVRRRRRDFGIARLCRRVTCA